MDSVADSIKAIIFDFNGTLFWDSPFHEEAWNIMAEKLRGYPYTKKEINEYMHGKTNREIIAYLIQRTETDAFFESIAHEKENLYKDICLKNKATFKLADGVPEWLDKLSSNGIPMTIATSSDKGNVDFFIEHFNLAKWFELSKIVYNDHSFPGKPAPDIFLKAATKLETKPSQCIVFEDSIAGVEAAMNAGIFRIIGVNSNENFGQYKIPDSVFTIIDTFQNLDIEHILNS